MSQQARFGIPNLEPGPPTRKPRYEERPLGKPRQVKVSQFFWLDMSVPFNSVAGEQKNASSAPKQFPLLIMGAWSNLTLARVRLTSQSTGVPLSTLEVPIKAIAGNSNLVQPIKYWRKPYFLQGNTSLRGEFINDNSEAAGNLIFYCERPDLYQTVEVNDSVEYELLLNLGLSGGASGTGTATSQQVGFDLLVYGAYSTSTGMNVRFFDNRLNQAWSTSQLPIGCFAGIDGNAQPVVYFSTPYYLPANSQIVAEWTNAGAETGKFVTFICERIIR